MQEKFLISPEQKEPLFHTELVKYGIPYHKAAKAAKILVSNPPEETLTDEDQTSARGLPRVVKAASAFRFCAATANNV